MTFWTRASKHVFPKRSAKMIDGTEKPKICKPHSAIQVLLEIVLGQHVNITYADHDIYTGDQVAFRCF